MISSAQIAVQPEHQQRLHTDVVTATHFGDVARELPGNGITLAAEIADEAQIGFRSGNRHALGENSHHIHILLRVTVATYDVVVEHGFDVPSLGLGHLCEVAAAIQSLLFPGYGQEYD